MPTYRIGSAAVVASTLLLMNCKSGPVNAAAMASLTDPRMLCAKSELSKLGYEVDESFREPGRYVATRQFPIVIPHRVEISASIDSTRHDLEVWARVLRRDGVTPANIMVQPPVSMLADAMTVENRCDNAK